MTFSCSLLNFQRKDEDFIDRNTETLGKRRKRKNNKLKKRNSE